MPSSTVNLSQLMRAPPFIIRVAASGTTKTLKPLYMSDSEILAMAVVLPAQGPPVMQIFLINSMSPLLFI
jgi:hypothetical protein